LANRVEVPDRPTVTSNGSQLGRYATELYDAFEQLLPMLQAVEPHKLNATLTAMATALRGQGEELGETLVAMGEFFGEFNPHMPELEEQFTELATFSDTLAAAAPDLLQSLDNFRTPSRSLVEEHSTLADMHAAVTAGANDLRAYLEANRNNIIRVGEISKPGLQLLEKYTPSVPCVTKQMADAVPLIDEALGKGTGHPGLRAKVVIGPAQPKYEPGQDEAEFNFVGGEWGTYRGPWCLDPTHSDIPDPLPYPYRMLYSDDGSKRQPDAKSDLDGKGLPCDAIDTFGNSVPQRWLEECAQGTAPDGSGNRFTSSGGGGGGAGADPGSPANTPGENNLLANLVGLQTGADPADFPSWGSLLVGPLYRGAEVEIK
jgi:hypothetical protein